jgi:DNA-binding XRE family transcriptional regulator
MKIVNNLPRLIKLKQEQYRTENNADLTEVHMAINIGVNPATFSHYKNGKVDSINWEIWQKLVKYFGVQGHEIFDVLLDDDTK